MEGEIPNVVLIGAGSIAFTTNLVRDLLERPVLRESRVVLHDVDAERLRLAHAAAAHVAGRVGVDASIESEPDRRRALAGADFVISTIRVGGHPASVADFEIPARAGIRQTMADTCGIGAIFHALRTIPAMLELGRDMAELCPQAWLLNYTNPMAMLVWAVYAGTPHRRVVGLCPSIRETARELAELAGVPAAEVTYVGAGINHQAWLLRLEHRGRDLYPAVADAIERDPDGIGRRARVELYRRFGYFPSESSEHTVEPVPYFLPHTSMIERFRVPVGEYLVRSARGPAVVAETARALADGEPLELDDWEEDATMVMEAISGGRPRRVHASVRNSGLIANLPDGCCVEVPCLVDATGVRPLPVGELPPQLAALNRTFAGVCELVVRAAVDGCGDHIRHAALLDPSTAATLSPDEIGRLCDDMLAGQLS